MDLFVKCHLKLRIDITVHYINNDCGVHALQLTVAFNEQYNARPIGRLKRAAQPTQIVT